MLSSGKKRGADRLPAITLGNWMAPCRQGFQ
jgi:hypothetical protein